MRAAAVGRLGESDARLATGRRPARRLGLGCGAEGLDGVQGVERVLDAEAEDEAADVGRRRELDGRLGEARRELVREEDKLERRDVGQERLELLVQVVVVRVGKPQVAEPEDLVVKVVGGVQRARVVLETAPQHVARRLLSLLDLPAVVLHVLLGVAPRGLDGLAAKRPGTALELPVHLDELEVLAPLVRLGALAPLEGRARQVLVLLVGKGRERVEDASTLCGGRVAVESVDGRIKALDEDLGRAAHASLGEPLALFAHQIQCPSHTTNRGRPRRGRHARAWQRRLPPWSATACAPR